ncbi:MAG: T9SS type A sorting domain-containing protein, partial [Candidatus Zixiibacteriota bacterium]
SSLSSEANATVPHDSWTVLGSPGDTVGATHYDYQSNGSTGSRIVKDYLGGFHFTWMNGIGFWQGNRWVWYNFLDENVVWPWPKTGTQVNTTQGAGYCQIDVLSDGRAVVAYHSANNALYTCIGIDVIRGFGVFTEIDVPEVQSQYHYYWPYTTIDRADRIHLICTEKLPSAGDPTPFMYTRSADEGYSWTNPEIVDTVIGLSQIIVSSNVSDRVAIVYATREYENPEDIPDVYYIESEDGTHWDWSNKVNITNYQPGDTVGAWWSDLDAVYDYGDDLHVIWNTPIRDRLNETLLWHWSEETGITLVAAAKWNSNPGAWNRSIAKVSIAVDSSDNLFALWSQFTEEDTSAGGYSNGDLYMSYSTDGGLTWGEPENITNSPSPGCWPGQCDNDHWSSLAEEVDDYLHIVYINDKDAGGIPQSEGVDTENPVLYLRVENPARQANVQETKSSLPMVTSLLQNYPNPFNATTEITYQLATDGPVKLEIFNLLGEKVETVVDEKQTPGEKSVIWDASGFSSGTYFCRLTAGDLTQIRRMTLLR